MLICRCCYKTLEESDLSSFQECHGYSSLGQGFNETIVDYGCSCGGEYEDAKRCKVCGEYMPESHGYICSYCKEENITLENAIALSAKSHFKYDVEVSELAQYLFNEDKINEILNDYIKAHYTDNSPEIRKYLLEDEESFADFVKAEMGE